MWYRHWLLRGPVIGSNVGGWSCTHWWKELVIVLCFICRELSSCLLCEGYRPVLLLGGQAREGRVPSDRAVGPQWSFSDQKKCAVNAAWQGEIRICLWRLCLNAISRSRSGAIALLEVSKLHSNSTWQRAKLFVLWFTRSEGQCQDEWSSTCWWLRWIPTR